MMSRREARDQSLASCGAVLIAFIGVCHEFAGHIVFPWAPATLGGPVGWHGLGIFAVVVGLLLLGGTLRLIRFPVVPGSVAIAALGIAIGAFTAVAHHEFHMFAFAGVGAAATTARYHRTPARQGTHAGRLAATIGR
jgi:hypothetical protein